MAKKQHAWALLTPTAQSLLESSMAQPSGKYVTVMDNDGNEMQVAELHGGFALIGQLSGWNMVVGCGMYDVFQSMITQLQTVGAQMGQSVGVLFSIVDDIEGTEQPNYAQLDIEMTVEAKAPIDVWLTAHGHEAAPSGTYREVIEYVGGLCADDGYSVGSVTIS